jgi:2-oxoacid:acceptor oxidoreductase delta subunit (pyruvate/2-ketoisovalerate family)
VAHAVCEGVRFEFLSAPVALLPAAPVPAEGLDGVEASFDEDRSGVARARVASVRCQRMRLGEPDASGRPRPTPVPGSEFFLAADTVLLALGEDSELEFAPGLLDRATGVVRVNPLGATGRAAVFAGGDLLDEPHTVAYALGSGKRAAIGIDHYLARLRGEGPDALELGALRVGAHGNLSATRWRDDDPVRRAAPVNEVAGPETIQTHHFAHAPRHPDRFRPAESTRRDFREAVRGLTRDEALAEAGRCLNCGVCNTCEVCLIFCPDVAISKGKDGALVIDDAYCKGCGICAAECPRGAITMTREGL